jgi:excisionase family DNA binding protein
MIRIETREIVSPSDAAQRIGVSTRRILQLVEAGRLPAIMDSSGRRTFRVEDLERLARDRQRRVSQ